MTRGAAIGGSITFVSVIGLPLLPADQLAVARRTWLALFVLISVFTAVGGQRPVLHQVIEGERCVLLCSGNGVGLDMLGHFTARLEARKRHAEGGEDERHTTGRSQG